jgi:hypothetical protein
MSENTVEARLLIAGTLCLGIDAVYFVANAMILLLRCFFCVTYESNLEHVWFSCLDLLVDRIQFFQGMLGHCQNIN